MTTYFLMHLPAFFHFDQYDTIATLPLTLKAIRALCKK